MHKTAVYILTNTKEGKFIEDKDQALSIQNALSNSLTTLNHQVERYEFDGADSDALRKQICSTEVPSTQHVIIAIGDHGISAINELHGTFPYNVVFAWAGHQVFENLETIKDKADIVALPQHVLAMVDRSLYESDKTKVILSAGVVIANSVEQLLNKAAAANDITDKILGDAVKKVFSSSSSAFSLFVNRKKPDATSDSDCKDEFKATSSSYKA